MVLKFVPLTQLLRRQHQTDAESQAGADLILAYSAGLSQQMSSGLIGQKQKILKAVTFHVHQLF